ncbi:hypothetical protein C0V75_05195 [Tabrizicola sp. TH137]|uniref:hypothetical protein n=1 Tax=Tabrizicola sp. TH137 TaxID=2067452 RepID=UPI000C7DFE6B|nr:hypothetical protein [Tabrizicola sp. TH137]PLL14806.1 hypothetical protein C0V75_05195 [Tabrizicola sp. TH137]
MNTVTISIEAATEAWAEEKARAEGYASASEYVAFLVQRERDIEHLRSLLDVDESDVLPVDDAIGMVRAEIRAAR